MSLVIEGENILKYRLLVIRSALRLESIGMRGKVSAAAIARSILSKAGFVAKRNKKDLLVQFNNYINSLEN